MSCSTAGIGDHVLVLLRADGERVDQRREVELEAGRGARGPRRGRPADGSRRPSRSRRRRAATRPARPGRRNGSCAASTSTGAAEPGGDALERALERVEVRLELVAPPSRRRAAARSPGRRAARARTPAPGARPGKLPPRVPPPERLALAQVDAPGLVQRHACGRRGRGCSGRRRAGRRAASCAAPSARSRAGSRSRSAARAGRRRRSAAAPAAPGR